MTTSLCYHSRHGSVAQDGPLGGRYGKFPMAGDGDWSKPTRRSSARALVVAAAAMIVAIGYFFTRVRNPKPGE